MTAIDITQPKRWNLLAASMLVLSVGAISVCILPFVSSGSIGIFAILMFLLAIIFLFAHSHAQISKENLGHQDPLSIWDMKNEHVRTDILLEDLPVALIRLNGQGVLSFSNIEARNLLGSKCKKDVLFSDLVEGLGRSMRERVHDTLTGCTTRTTEMGRCLRDGQEVFLQVSLMQMPSVTGACCIVVLSDKTELKTLEAQFVQSQKMKAVGQLSGGVAHDFNNLITAINGHSDLLLLRHKQGDPDYGDLIQIRQNSVRAAALVGQLLAFSRKQTLRPKVVNILDTMNDLTTLLNRLLGEKVALIMRENRDLDAVRIDVRQFEQVIMNLVVNARDAMPDGGEVVICTQNIEIKTAVIRERANIPAGKYVKVTVFDHGCGIDPDTLPKIFEPFFTTKRVGEGTGLGLSTVYGIIKQTGGFIFAKSDLGKGTRFEILLPAQSAIPAAQPVTFLSEKLSDNTPTKGHILLAEDEDAVRSFAVRALELKGYTVDEVSNGEQALAVLENSKRRYDLFISDVIMPKLNGPGWIIQAKEKHPEARVLFISGYSEDAFADGKKQVFEAGFLSKPFSLKELSDKVVEMLA